MINQKAIRNLILQLTDCIQTSKVLLPYQSIYRIQNPSQSLFHLSLYCHRINLQMLYVSLKIILIKRKSAIGLPIALYYQFVSSIVSPAESSVLRQLSSII